MVILICQGSQLASSAARWVWACDLNQSWFTWKEIDLEPWPCATKYQYFGQRSLELFVPVARGGSWAGTKDSRGRTSYPVSGSSSTYSVQNAKIMDNAKCTLTQWTIIHIIWAKCTADRHLPTLCKIHSAQKVTIYLLCAKCILHDCTPGHHLCNCAIFCALAKIYCTVMLWPKCNSAMHRGSSSVQCAFLQFWSCDQNPIAQLHRRSSSTLRAILTQSMQRNAM